MTIEPFQAAFEARAPRELGGQPRRCSQAENGDRFFLQYDWVGGHLGAVAFIRMQLRPRSSELWIASLEVHPFFRDRGFGSALVAAVEHAAGAQDIRLLHLFPRLISLGFWRRLGFGPDPGSRRFSKRLANAVPAR